jgi:hypothetical protein
MNALLVILINIRGRFWAVLNYLGFFWDDILQFDQCILFYMKIHKKSIKIRCKVNQRHQKIYQKSMFSLYFRKYWNYIVEKSDLFGKQFNYCSYMTHLTLGVFTPCTASKTLYIFCTKIFCAQLYFDSNFVPSSSFFSIN